MCAPALCSAFKGILPSDLRLKYAVEGGRHLMEIDLVVASEISDRIAEQSDDKSPQAASRKARRAVEKRNQRRQMDSEGLREALSDTFGNVGDE